MTQLDSNWQLIEGYRRGDLDAERELFEKFRAPLLRKAAEHPLAGTLAPAEAPEDVVQEVYRRALKAGLLERFENRRAGGLEAMLTTVLDRTIHDMARRRGCSKRGGHAAHTSLPEGGEASGLYERRPDTPTSIARNRDLLHFCREQLEEEEWIVWRAVELEGWAKAALAKASGTSLHLLNNKLHSAKRKLVAATRRTGLADSER